MKINKKHLLIITAVVITIIAAVFLYTQHTDRKTRQTSQQAQIQQSQQKTDAAKKEVRQNVQQITELHRQNDAAAERNIQNAIDAVPSDIDALIVYANTIISDSHKNQPRNSTNVTD